MSFHHELYRHFSPFLLLAEDISRLFTASYRVTLRPCDCHQYLHHSHQHHSVWTYVRQDRYLAYEYGESRPSLAVNNTKAEILILIMTLLLKMAVLYWIYAALAISFSCGIYLLM